MRECVCFFDRSDLLSLFRFACHALRNVCLHYYFSICYIVCLTFDKCSFASTFFSLNINLLEFHVPKMNCLHRAFELYRKMACVISIRV